MPHDVDDEIARAGERVENVDVVVCQRRFECGLQNMLDGGDHEIHERLRGIDYAVSVGNLDGKTLKEPFVDSVEERLFLVKIGNSCGGVLDCTVEMLQTLAKVVPTERTGVESGNDRFNFLRDDVSLDKIGDGEYLSKNTLREDVLDNHFLDGFNRNVRIERAAAERTEAFKRSDELLVGLTFFFDKGFQARTNLWDFVAEFLDGLFPFRDGGRSKLQKK